MPNNITNVSEYYRYEEICILRNGKKWIIDRDRYVLANTDTELEMRISRVVLFEKYKPLPNMKECYF
jgi:hypothetical protein